MIFCNGLNHATACKVAKMCCTCTCCSIKTQLMCESISNDAPIMKHVCLYFCTNLHCGAFSRKGVLSQICIATFAVLNLWVLLTPAHGARLQDFGIPGTDPLLVFRPAPGHLIRSTVWFWVREADSCLQQRFHGGAETHSLRSPRASRTIPASGIYTQRELFSPPHRFSLFFLRG